MDSVPGVKSPTGITPGVSRSSIFIKTLVSLLSDGCRNHIRHFSFTVKYVIRCTVSRELELIV